MRRLLSWSALLTAVVAGATLRTLGAYLSWTALPVLAAGVAASLLMHPRSGPRRITASVAATALAAVLAAPALFSAESVRLAHVGSGPMAGPGRGAATTSLLAGTSGAPDNLTGGLIGLAGFYSPLTPRTAAAVAADAESYTWAAAAMGARSAAAYELSVDEPILAIGGYKGTDPLPTLTQFQAMVRAHQIHWLIPGGTTGPSGQAIQTWVTDHFAAQQIDGRTLYDLSAAAGT